MFLPVKSRNVFTDAVCESAGLSSSRRFTYSAPVSANYESYNFIYFLVLPWSLTFAQYTRICFRSSFYLSSVHILPVFNYYYDYLWKSQSACSFFLRKSRHLVSSRVILTSCRSFLTSINQATGGFSPRW